MDKPKRPLSSYMLWLNEQREGIKRDNPGIKVTEIAKKGGELWRAMKDKSEWEAKAVKHKDDYAKALKEYEANGGQPDTKKRGKATKRPTKKTKKDLEDDESDDDASD